MSDPYRFEDGSKFKLSDIDPADTGIFASKDDAEAKQAKDIAQLSVLHDKLYVDGRFSLLVILQGMDTSGKDGTIRHVFTGLNPQGCRVTSFKKPSDEDLAHDFLWRISKALPERGTLGIFNRSHYEDVLVVRVHNLVPKDVWSKRYEEINHFEQRLANEGTTILKFFLYISKGEQAKRIRARVDDPRKRWKFTAADMAERRYWKDYLKAYQEAIRECSTPWAPWYVVPSNHKWYRNYVVANAIAKALARMELKLPKTHIDPAVLKRL
jgi:PPK2 family polyphosphate:nucleotide phosphotransferase